MRALARQCTTPYARSILLKLAADFDAMADQAGSKVRAESHAPDPGEQHMRSP